MKQLHIIRYDIKEEKSQTIEFEQDENFPANKEALLTQLDLPSDSITKLYYNGSLIPWSLLSTCNGVEVKVFRPHQNSESVFSLQCHIYKVNM